MDPRPAFDPERPPEHAFGTIHEITVPLRWTHTPKNPNRKARRFVDATTETWSVNGVGFVTNADRDIPVGGILTIKIGPVEGEVAVRSTRPADAPGSTYYGAEFISDDLQSVARDLISIHLRHRPVERERSSRSPFEADDVSQRNLRDWT